ncbi:MAG: DUF421 domain-containing protein [Clostridia bacterium]|nr:DUF421 domain-containing protein [Clostridia bacterium]
MIISVIRTIILYILVIFSVRLMGKRQIGELQPAELVITLMISNIATIPMENASIPMLGSVVPIILLTAAEIFISYAMMGSTKLRTLISGQPVIVIKEGKIIQAAMKKLRLTVDDLLEALRKNGVFDLSSVRYAIVETDGTLSVLQYKEQTPATVGDLQLDTCSDEFFAAVVQDGKPSQKVLSLLGRDENWLKNTLKKEKTDICSVFVMTCNKKGDYTIVKKEDEK